MRAPGTDRLHDFFWPKTRRTCVYHRAPTCSGALDAFGSRCPTGDQSVEEDEPPPASAARSRLIAARRGVHGHTRSRSAGTGLPIYGTHPSRGSTVWTSHRFSYTTRRVVTGRGAAYLLGQLSRASLSSCRRPSPPSPPREGRCVEHRRRDAGEAGVTSPCSCVAALPVPTAPSAGH